MGGYPPISPMGADFVDGEFTRPLVLWAGGSVFLAAKAVS
jgi:hypothetical protein